MTARRMSYVDAALSLAAAAALTRCSSDGANGSPRANAPSVPMPTDLSLPASVLNTATRRGNHQRGGDLGVPTRLRRHRDGSRRRQEGDHPDREALRISTAPLVQIALRTGGTA